MIQPAHSQYDLSWADEWVVGQRMLRSYARELRTIDDTAQLKTLRVSKFQARHLTMNHDQHTCVLKRKASMESEEAAWFALLHC